MRELPIFDLEPGMVLARDVFAEDDLMPYLPEGTALDRETIGRMRRRGIEAVVVEGEAPPERPRPVLETVKSTLHIPEPSIGPKLRNRALASLEDVYSDILISDEGIYGTGQIVEGMDEVVGRLVGSLAGHKKALVNIGDLKSFDDYTYHHSLSVAVLAIGIGQHLGMRQKELNRLGLAAMMHDIGKTVVPVEIIRKPSRLTDEEFALVQRHSRAGSSFMTNSSIGDEVLWDTVLHHHEKLDGTGYPDGIAGNTIPLWSRIISVADVFDALTSNRPYRTPMAPADALEYIMGGIGTHFDYDIVTALIQKVALYPVGSVIELSNGHFAVVLDNENQLRPIVETLGTGDVVDLYNDRQFLSVVVKRVVPDEELATLSLLKQ